MASEDGQLIAEAEAMAPPWDEWATWGEFGPDAWSDHLDSLAAWVSWLREAYRVVELPPCWADHEGLRLELATFWNWWLALHGRIRPEQFGGQVGTLLSWHDYLRRASESWREHYAKCEHNSVEVDQVGRARQRFRDASTPFLEEAFRHERQARADWQPWTPVSIDSPEQLRQAVDDT